VLLLPLLYIRMAAATDFSTILAYALAITVLGNAGYGAHRDLPQRALPNRAAREWHWIVMEHWLCPRRDDAHLRLSGKRIATGDSHGARRVHRGHLPALSDRRRRNPETKGRFVL